MVWLPTAEFSHQLRQGPRTFPELVFFFKFIIIIFPFFVFCFYSFLFLPLFYFPFHFPFFTFFYFLWPFLKLGKIVERFSNLWIIFEFANRFFSHDFFNTWTYYWNLWKKWILQVFLKIPEHFLKHERIFWIHEPFHKFMDIF